MRYSAFILLSIFLFSCEKYNTPAGSSAPDSVTKNWSGVTVGLTNVGAYDFIGSQAWIVDESPLDTTAHAFTLHGTQRMATLQLTFYAAKLVPGGCYPVKSIDLRSVSSGDRSLVTVAGNNVTVTINKSEFGCVTGDLRGSVSSLANGASVSMDGSLLNVVISY